MSRHCRFSLFPLLLGYILGFSSVVALPIWLASAAHRFSLSSAESGLLGSLELGCVACASLLAAAFPGAMTRRRIAVAAILSVAANLLSYFSPTALLLAAARALVGWSQGVLLAEATGRAARRADAQRVFVLQQFALVVFAVTFFACAPALMRLVGAGEPFLFIAAVGTVTLLSLSALDASAGGNDTDAVIRVPLRGKTPLPLAMAFATLVLTFCIQAAMWTYLARAAGRAGIGMDGLSTVLAIGSAGNLLAPMVAARLIARVDRKGPLLTGFVGLGLASLGLGIGTNPVLFTACAIGLTAFQIFLVPWLLDTLLVLDRSGRAAAAGPSFMTIGSALGPIAGGMLIGARGLPLLGMTCLIGALAALGLINLAAVRARTSRAPVGC